jgi:hypothetical protein
MVKGKGDGAELAYLSLTQTIKDAIEAQANLHGSLLLNLSTSFRICVLVQQLLSRKVSLLSLSLFLSLCTFREDGSGEGRERTGRGRDGRRKRWTDCKDA